MKLHIENYAPNVDAVDIAAHAETAKDMIMISVWRNAENEVFIQYDTGSPRQTTIKLGEPVEDDEVRA